MSSHKFQVFLVAEESKRDSKTTVIYIKRIRLFNEDRWFHIPSDFQQVTQFHTELAMVGPVAAALKSIQWRGQSRLVNVSVTQTVSEPYLDEDDNFYFR